MKKSDMYNKINRNTFSNNPERVTTSHVFTSDIFMNALWAQEEDVERPSGVRIVELKSSQSNQSVNDNKDAPKDQRNSTLTNDDFSNMTHENYIANEAAREKRRIRNQRIAEQYDEEMNKYENYLYNELILSTASEIHNEGVVYNKDNCFKIFNKQFLASDTSDEDIGNDDVEVINCGDSSWNQDKDIGNGDVEVINCGDSSWNQNQDIGNGDVEVINCGDSSWYQDPAGYDSELATYTSETDNEKKTVWIYSFKNKRLLSDNDFELVNIPSQDASTISSADIEDFQGSKTECPKLNRVATPIPSLHIPTLNLSLAQSPTLPTMTEITEPKTSPKKELKCNIKGKLNVKANNWFLSERASPASDNIQKLKADKSTSIINWMALSPREKRCRLKHTSPIIFDNEHLPPLKEVSSMIEQNGEFTCKEQKDRGDSLKTNSKINFNDQGTNTIESFNAFSNRSRRSMFDHIGSAVVDSARKSVQTLRSNVSSAIGGSLTTVIENTTASKIELTEKSNDNEPQTKSDSGRENNNKSLRPRIRIPRKHAIQIISDPMENLNSDNWIHEEKLIKDKNYIKIPTDGQGDRDRASEALWIRNMALLKPAEWTAYLPIAESIPSLQLSMNTDSIEERQPFFRRLLNFFRCCK